MKIFRNRKGDNSSSIMAKSWIRFVDEEKLEQNTTTWNSKNAIDVSKKAIYTPSNYSNNLGK